MPAIDDLRSFEKDLDDRMAKLPLLTLPLRTVLTMVYGVVDNRFNGNFLATKPTPQSDAGYALAARLSYLVLHLLRCPIEPSGTDAADALSAFKLTHAPQLSLLLQYGHFCELMPQVHRGYYAVASDPTNTRRFLLTHTTPEFAAHEARDIVLSELAMPFFLPHRLIPESVYDRQARSLRRFDLGVFMLTLTKLYEHYLEHGYEMPIMTDEGYRDALGTDRETFVRFRAAWVALADYCLGMAAAFSRKAWGKSGKKLDAIINERHEWTAVMWKTTFTLGIISGITKIKGPELDLLCRFFFIDGNSAAPHAGEGFYPPVWQFEKGLLFNPDIVRVMLASRNIPYVMNKTQQDRFDALVSKTLEPQLIKDAAALLGQLKGIEVICNHSWGPGEIDLLAYSATDNVAVHVQAKAAIPADSARMVRAVETRAKEGLDQLARLRKGGQAQVDAVISAALKKPITNVTLIDALLCRTGIGTSKIWRMLGDVVPMNLTLLNAAVCRIASRSVDGHDATLSGFAGDVTGVLDEVFAAAFKRWEHEDVVIADGVLNVPLLRLDQRSLQAYRQKFHPG